MKLTKEIIEVLKYHGFMAFTWSAEKFLEKFNTVEEMGNAGFIGDRGAMNLLRSIFDENGINRSSEVNERELEKQADETPDVELEPEKIEEEKTEGKVEEPEPEKVEEVVEEKVEEPEPEKVEEVVEAPVEEPVSEKTKEEVKESTKKTSTKKTSTKKTSTKKES